VSWADLESLDGNRPFKEPDPNYDNIMAPYNERIYQLLSTPLPEDEWGELTPLPVHFSAGAKALWIKYQNESQAWMKPRGKWKPIRAFGEKALEHAARLGVVLQQFNSCSLELSAEYFAAGSLLRVLRTTQSCSRLTSCISGWRISTWVISSTAERCSGKAPRLSGVKRVLTLSSTCCSSTAFWKRSSRMIASGGYTGGSKGVAAVARCRKMGCDS
jgi:hypothetical protein